VRLAFFSFHGPALGALFACSLSACGNGDDGSNSRAAADDAAVDATTDGPVDAAVDASGLPRLDGFVPDLDANLQEPCNGDPSFCDKTYDALSYATTHGAMAYAFPPFACPAQTVSVRKQLDQGVRALDLEAHASTSAGDADAATTLDLCLGDCASGALPIGVAIADVSAFLAVNPREVVTLLVEGGVDAGALQSSLAAAGLDALAYSKAIGDPWPTLRAMITAGKRVVVLADTTGAAPDWMLPLWTYVDETGRTFASPQSMTCDVARGAPGAPLFLLNQFLVDSDGATTSPADAGDAGNDGGSTAPGCDDPVLAHVANAEPFFGNRVNACTQERGAKPTFVSVDDFEDGDAMNVVHSLNQ
jgi:hypothetical protein